MSDLGELFNAAREAGKERRASNRDTTPQVLRDHGLTFEVKNSGAHLVVRHGDAVADLWPGTGKYQVRRGKWRGPYRRGVFNLLRDLGVDRQTQTSPVEVLRAIAQDIADDQGLEVDHAAFDRAATVLDRPAGERCWQGAGNRHCIRRKGHEGPCNSEGQADG
jgi:hypothetical protein